MNLFAARLFLALALSASAAGGTGARDARALDTDVAVLGGRVRATVDLGPAFPPDTLHELGNGLSNVVAIYVTIVPEGGSQPVALFGRIVEVLWDVWNESFMVTVKDSTTPEGDHLIVPTQAGLRTLLASARDIDLGPASALPKGRILLEARVELNPVSKEQLQRTREYIASAGARAGGSRSVLGAMASFLLREPAPDAEVALLRSRPLSLSQVDR